MFISIVIPVLNQEEYLEEAILSVLSQDHEEKELIIIDGGSNDRTIEVIRKYEKQISYWVSEPDFGQSDAIRKGMKKAKGEIVNWLNADDYLLPQALSKVNEVFSKSNFEVVCSKVLRLRQGKGMEDEFSQTRLESCTEKTIVYGSMGQPGQFYLKRIWEELGGVSTEFHYSMDKDLWIRYLAKYGHDKVAVVSFSTAVFRLHSGSKTENDGGRFKEEDKRIELRVKEQNKIAGDVLLLQSYYFGKESMDLYAQASYQEARKLAWKAIRGGAWDTKGLVVCFLKVLLLPGFLINWIRSTK